MKPTLYSFKESPPVRAVLIIIKYLDIDVNRFEMKWYDDFRKPEFIKLNPQHTVPTLVDENRPLCDSHAINIYLISKYAKNDDLYPKNLFQRAVVDQRMHFDNSQLISVLRCIDLGILNNKIQDIPKYLIEETKENYAFLEKMLEGNKWVAGNNTSLADFSIMSSISALDYHIPIDPQIFSNIISWLERVQELPCCSEDADHLKAFKKLMNFHKLQNVGVADT